MRPSVPTGPYPPNSQLSSDVAIIGAGPVGCVTALAFARAGARVCLLDAGMHSLRLAGEWLHPTGAGILSELGIELPKANVECALGRGFAIFPKRAEPIVLPYVSGELGGSAAAIARLRTHPKKKLDPRAYPRHFFPEPRLELGRILREIRRLDLRRVLSLTLGWLSLR